MAEAEGVGSKMGWRQREIGGGKRRNPRFLEPTGSLLIKGGLSGHVPVLGALVATGVRERGEEEANHAGKVVALPPYRFAHGLGWLGPGPVGPGCGWGERKEGQALLIIKKIAGSGKK